MKNLMASMLATDEISQAFGCGLKPELRAAMQADLRFPSRAASPMPSADDMSGTLPENVQRLTAQPPASRKASA